MKTTIRFFSEARNARSGASGWLLVLGLACGIGVAGLFSGCSSEASENAFKPHSAQAPKRLNNLVTDLARIPLPVLEETLVSFDNPREGWVFFSVPPSAAKAKDFTVRLKNDPIGQSLFTPGGGAEYEAMRWLPAGTNEVAIQSRGTGELLIRAIPELMLLRMGIAEYFDPDATNALNKKIFLMSNREQHGADRMFFYYWNYLRKNVLKQYNAVAMGSSPVQSPWLEDWTAAGKKIIGASSLHDVSNAYEKWSPYFKPPSAGLILDEFVPPSGNADAKEGYRPGLGFTEDVMGAIRKIYDDKSLTGSVYGFLGVPSSLGAKECLPLLETLIPRGYKWAYERYPWPMPTEAEARVQIDKTLSQAMRDFETHYPGCVRSCLLTLATLYQWDSRPQVDQKTWLDLQMQLIATDPVFDGLFGLSFWSPTTTDPELLEWMSLLFRHYAIEGKTDLLSSQYGYTLMLDYLKNIDFSQETLGWELQEAAEGSVRVKALADVPIKQGYLPTAPQMLTLRRDAKRPNVVRQTIRNLVPGHLYSFRMFVCDPQKPVDMSDSATWQIYAHTVRFEGAQELTDRRRQDLQRGDGLVKDVCWNYVYRVFRATGETAVLTISDWATPDAPGGPIDQTLALTHIKIQPLFEPESTL